jgi:hypothetical protein
LAKEDPARMDVLRRMGIEPMLPKPKKAEKQKAKKAA